MKAEKDAALLQHGLQEATATQQGQECFENNILCLIVPLHHIHPYV